MSNTKKKKNYIYKEEFKIAKGTPLTKQELQHIFNEKYYLFIKRKEARLFKD